jgi:hypothetical protein
MGFDEEDKLSLKLALNLVYLLNKARLLIEVLTAYK